MDRAEQLKAVLARLRGIGAEFGAAGLHLRRLAQECEALLAAVEAAPKPKRPRQHG